jgi:hypothetical protein
MKDRPERVSHGEAHSAIAIGKPIPPLPWRKPSEKDGAEQHCLFIRY